MNTLQLESTMPAVQEKKCEESSGRDVLKDGGDGAEARFGS